MQIQMLYKGLKKTHESEKPKIDFKNHAKTTIKYG